LARRRARLSRAPRDLLHPGVLLHAPAAALATDAALLEAAERPIEHVDAVVDPYHAGADALRHLDGARRVARVDRAAQPVGRVVRDPDRLLVVGEGYHGHHRAADLLARDADVVAHVAEDGGLQEVAARQTLGTPTAGPERRALGPAGADVLLDLLPPLLADHRTEHGPGIGRIADLHHVLHEADHVLHEAVVHVLLHQHARRHGAALSGVEHRRAGRHH